MNRAFWSEWLKLRRRGMFFAACLVAAGASLVVGLRVGTAGDPSSGGQFGPSAELNEQALVQADGFARALWVASDLVGAVVLAIFAFSVAAEFSQATIRNLLVREPRRLHLLSGKLLALMTYASAAVGAAVLVALAVATLAAQASGIDSSAWFGTEGLAETAGAGGRLVLATLGWGLLGAVLGLLLRSPTSAVAAGLAYALPVENLLASVWSGGERWLPGSLLETLAEGGSDETSFARAIALLAVYAGSALVLAAVTFERRDVTV
jgi:ABC-2 type transport system permease protein